MIVTYETTLVCRCPENGDRDVYELTVVSSETVVVERIIDVIDELAGATLYQEDATEFVAEALGDVTATTVGYHSGVKTTCVSS